MREVLTFILAGGRGERLDPLTRDRTKPAVPFGGIYRIIDFTLSNCVNSGLRRIHVLTQYKSFSLQKHLLAGWDIVSSQLGEFIDVVPAQQRISDDWYLGTADAIYQNFYTIKDSNPSLVMVLAGDHVYKMDYREMIAFHNAKKADMTVACIPMPKQTSASFGVIEANKGRRILGFQEKPKDPRTIPGRPQEIFASMGIYLFNPDVLEAELEKDAKNSASDHDFGKNVISQMLRNKRKVFVYDFVDQKGNAKYWRDIGTRDAYYEANMDLLGTKPKFNLFDRNWPVRTYHEQYPPINMVSSKSGHGSIVNSMVSGGCVIEGSVVDHSILSSNVRIHNGSEIKNSVIMEGVVVGERSKIQNAIIDKEVGIPAGTTIGYNSDADRKRFFLTTSGIVMVPKKAAVVS